jgi:hypothetical protein
MSVDCKPYNNNKPGVTSQWLTPIIIEGQTTQWPKEREQKDKQRSTSILTMKLPSGKLCKANL